jgi:hypothetical protein
MNWKPSAAVLCHLELVAPYFVYCVLNGGKGRLHIDKSRSRVDKQKRPFLIDCSNMIFLVPKDLASGSSREVRLRQ